MNPFTIKLNLKSALIALGVGITAMLFVLLTVSMILLNNVDDSYQQQKEQSVFRIASFHTLNKINQMISLIQETALTGDLGNINKANTLLEEAKIQMNKSSNSNSQSLLKEMAILQVMGDKLIHQYLLLGREQGNLLMLDKNNGYLIKANQLRVKLKNNLDYWRDKTNALTDKVGFDEKRARYFILASIIVLLIIIPIVLYFFYGKIMKSLTRITDTVLSIVENGDYSVRCKVNSGDELQILGDAFDKLLDERVGQLASIEKENNAINHSIINILEATGKLSNRDLRINVPVAEDITGAVSDSLNAAASDISKVLLEVQSVSGDVHSNSSIMGNHANKAYLVAEQNIVTVKQTLEQLAQGSESMNKVMALANHCYKISGTANQSTSQGLESVMSTTKGMGRIREGIQETSKRIKHLGERSQEISSIIGIIKDITERTHVLALNARIQAATAGEAGKGFSVVAEEVKQLAESSRSATSQIAVLIQNIQIETNDTIATMEKTVSQVVSGTELSEQAYEQMQKTQKTTQRLSESVRQIATSTKAQVALNEEISVHTDKLRNSAVNTQQELEQQREHSDKLNTLSQQLIDSVGEFTLPETA